MDAEKPEMATTAIILYTCLVLLVLTACTHVYEVPTVPVTEYPATEKVNLVVALRVSDELRTAKWEKHVMGDTFRIPLGETLSQNAEMIARRLFFKVIVTHTAEELANAKVNALLTPKMILAERTAGATAFGESIFTIMLEWTLQDTAGNIVWAETIKGEGHARTGNMFTHKRNAQKQINETIQDLFQRSFHALSASPEIRKFAATHERIALAWKASTVALALTGTPATGSRLIGREHSESSPYLGKTLQEVSK